MGAVAVADDERAEALRAWRIATGSIPGPFEAWLAHRSLATLGPAPRAPGGQRPGARRRRCARATTSAACAGRASARSSASTSGSQARADAFLGACELVAEATSFGGLHSNAERRARWGSDAVGEGFIRFNAGIEDAPDLVADVERALELSRP